MRLNEEIKTIAKETFIQYNHLSEVWWDDFASKVLAAREAKNLQLLYDRCEDLAGEKAEIATRAAQHEAEAAERYQISINNMTDDFRRQLDEAVEQAKREILGRLDNLNQRKAYCTNDFDQAVQEYIAELRQSLSKPEVKK